MKKVAILLSISLLSLLSIGRVFAQTSEVYNPLDPQLPQSVSDSINDNGQSLPSTTATTVMSTAGVYLCGVWGGETCTSDANQQQTYFRNYGLIPQIQLANIAMFINPPASTGLAIRDIGQTLGFIPKQSYAQSVGFNGLLPILNMWKAFRNFAYVLLSVVLIAVGFMVMFRTKIDPHTVASVQAALPRLIITLILITFSYAIVALVIDLSYVILLVAYSVFRTAGLPSTIQTSTIFSIPTGTLNTQQVFLSGTLFDTLGTVFPNGFASFGALVEKLTGVSTAGMFAAGTGIGIGGALLTLINPLAGIAAMVVGFGLPILVQLLIGILLLILLARIFFLFLNSYIQIILRTILGPLQLVLGVIPGQNTSLNWIRTIIAHMSVFVVSGMMFMLAATFNSVFNGNTTSQGIWSPPYFPIQITTGNVSAFFVLGILTIIPQIAGQVRQMIIGQGNQDVNMAGGVFGGLSGATGLGMQVYHLWSSHNMQKALKERNKHSGGGGGAST